MDDRELINAADLADGTQAEYQGRVFTAFPAYCSVLRWHAGEMLLTDEAMTAALADGAARITGYDHDAIEIFEQVLGDCRHH